VQRQLLQQCPALLVGPGQEAGAVEAEQVEDLIVHRHRGQQGVAGQPHVHALFEDRERRMTGVVVGDEFAVEDGGASGEQVDKLGQFYWRRQISEPSEWSVGVRFLMSPSLVAFGPCWWLCCAQHRSVHLSGLGRVG
jgi:hypothetical protein